jgi:dolichol-phosphate mannosyltransferase
MLSPNHRQWLRRPHPWLALLIALVVFSPVIIWNAQHEWASFVFQSTRTAGTTKNMLRDVLLFWLFQLFVLTPPFLALFAWAAARGIQCGWRQRDDRWNFVASFSLPLFVLFAAASFKTQVHVNWTAPAFLSLTLGGAAIALDGLCGQGHARAIWWRVGVGATVAMCALVIVFGHTSLAFGFPDFFAYTRSGGWNAVAQEVDAARARVRSETNLEPFVLGMEKYNIAAEMGFYLHAPDECVNLYATGAQGLGYRYWTDLRKFEGRPAVAVLPKPSDDLMALLRQHFERVGEAWHVRVPAHGRQSREVYLVICTGYHAVQRKPPGPA